MRDWHGIKHAILVVGAGLLLAPLLQVAEARQLPEQPYLGFQRHAVQLPEHLGLPAKIRGMYVCRVNRGSPAARAGLERGDIVVSIDSLAFRNRDGYLLALRRASQRPSLIVVNVRTGRLIRLRCHLPHVESDEPLNENVSLLAIDLVSDMPHGS